MIVNADFSRKPSIIPYLTYGDPSPEMSESLISACFDAGAQIVEVGVPFSDPIADGPVIQASHTRALSTGKLCNIKAALAGVVRLKQRYPKKKLVFMMSCNLLEAVGAEPFFSDAAKAGLDGLILPDLPIEAAKDHIQYAKKHKVSMIFLVSPLCAEDRLRSLVKHSSGFVYLVSSTGTTGERTSFSQKLPALVERIKKVKKIPVAVGFGVSTKAHVDELNTFADAAIIGSSLVKVVGQSAESPDILEQFKSALSKVGF